MIEINDLKTAGSTSKHQTKSGTPIIPKGANVPIYFNADDLSYLTKLGYLYPRKRSKIASLGLKLVQEKYGDKIPSDELI